MQPSQILKKGQAFFSTLLSKNNGNRTFILLSIFLLVVLLVSFIIPQLYFGRFYGSDGYNHLLYTNDMASSRGLSEFYENAGNTIDDPSDDANWFNYPFGLWLFGATIAKITGLPPISADFFFCTLFLLIFVGSFYAYCSTWLESREQKICAVLFLLSMPQLSLALMTYTPSIFVLPFLFFVLYFILKEPVNWKLLPIAWLSLFIIVISHTGTFIFLLSFSIAFFILYCLLFGKFSKPLYMAILSTCVIYVLSLAWFPKIASQYVNKSRLFLVPGNILATTFNFPLPGEVMQVFYKNLLVEQQLAYVVILAALLFVAGKVLVIINGKSALILSKRETFPAFILPIQKLSHSVIASPVWLGPVQVIFSVVGFFQINNKGKCFLFSALLVTLLPDLLQASQGTVVATGSLREISYLMIIIPVTATLGFWHITDYLNESSSKIKKHATMALLVVVMLVIIITPTLASTYYLPTLSGDEYTIGGLKWLGEHGDSTDRVVGWGLRPVRIYTNMTPINLEGGETRQFMDNLHTIFFASGDQSQLIMDLQKKIGLKYLISSDKVLGNFGGQTEDLTIDSNSVLSKIYASNDFGIYEVQGSSENPVSGLSLTDNISFKYVGGTYEIQSDYYKVTLGGSTPILKRMGPPENDFLNYGFFMEDFRISGTELSPGGEQFKLEDLEFNHEIKDNQIIYTTVLINPQSQVPVGTLLIRYTFYPDVIKREYALSNDWIVTRSSPQINVQYSIRSFSLMKEFVIKNDETRMERHTVVYEDSVTKNVNIEDFYLHQGNEGMYITFAGISPQPSSISYSGSRTNRSSIVISQPTSLKPGASFLSTQFISFGSELVAKKSIQNRVGIKLINYPDGITPILLSGFSSQQSDSFTNEKIASGYAVLNNNSIPYNEVINPSIRNENALNLQNVTVISAQKTGLIYYDDYATQETNLKLATDYFEKQNISNTGFMPDPFTYNLDTLTLLSKNNIPFLLSSQVNPIMNGVLRAKGYRTPQIAHLYSDPTGMVLFPVSFPKSTSLSSQTNNEAIFSDWRSTIDSAADNDEMVLLLIRAQDIGDPSYTENFVQLFSYAREKNLTFSSPARIAYHFNQLQNISYSGSIDGDMASIQVNNKNHVSVQNVTFKVILPVLADGNYRVNTGDIVRTKYVNNQSVLYIRTEIPADSTKNIIIEPDIQRKTLQIGIPQFPIEGSIEITVNDESGNPLNNVDILIDSTYHQTDEKGAVHVDLGRGYHTITVQSAGYEKYSSFFTVKGRIYTILEEMSRFY